MTIYEELFKRRNNIDREIRKLNIIINSFIIGLCVFFVSCLFILINMCVFKIYIKEIIYFAIPLILCFICIFSFNYKICDLMEQREEINKMISDVKKAKE